MLLGLVDEFGPQRVIDSPISEAGIAGLGVGAAFAGLKPIVDVGEVIEFFNKAAADLPDHTRLKGLRLPAHDLPDYIERLVSTFVAEREDDDWIAIATPAAVAARIRRCRSAWRAVGPPATAARCAPSSRSSSTSSASPAWR